AGLGHVAPVLAEGVTNLADGPVAVIGTDVDEHGYPAGAVALERELFIVDARQLPGTTLDCALDVVGRHVLCLGSGNRSAQPRIGIGISAVLGGNGDFLDQPGKNLAPLGVKCALFMFNCGPFGMARHRKTSRLMDFSCADIQDSPGRGDHVIASKRMQANRNYSMENRWNSGQLRDYSPAFAAAT